MTGGGAQAAERPASAELYLVYELERRAYQLKEAFTIGRDTESDLVILEPTVSRTHARVLSQGGAFVLENIGPTGTRVNGVRLEQPHELVYGDRIEIGTSILTVRSVPLPLGVMPVDRSPTRVLDLVTARRATIRHPLMTERPVERPRKWGTWIALIVVLALFAAMLLKR